MNKAIQNRAIFHDTKVYFDMDGTLAEWRPAASMEELLTPGYFASLAPHKHVVALAKDLLMLGYPVAILSAVLGPQQEREKREWLMREFGDLLSELTVVFVPCGANKSRYVDARGAVLLDDHSPNLWQWHAAEGIAIKAINQINGSGKSGKSWRGARIDALSPVPVSSFLALINASRVRVFHAPIRMPKAICLEAPVK